MKELNPLFLNQLRLGIVSLLAGIDSADFKWLQGQTEATSGNLSIQIKKLTEAGYLDVKKTFKNNYPLTSVSLTSKGHEALTDYVAALKTYLKL